MNVLLVMNNKPQIREVGGYKIVLLEEMPNFLILQLKIKVLMIYMNIPLQIICKSKTRIKISWLLVIILSLF